VAGKPTPRTKYQPWRVKRICDAIAKSGKQYEGRKAGGIVADTFHRWLREKPEFALKVEHAKECFVAKAYKEDPELFYKAVKALERLIQGVEDTYDYILKVKNEKGKVVETREKKGKFIRPPNMRAVMFLLENADKLREDPLPESVDFDFVLFEPPVDPDNGDDFELPPIDDGDGDGDPEGPRG